MRRAALFVLLGSSVFACAETRNYYLSPDFNGMDRAEFIQANEEFGKTLIGRLGNRSGEKISIPDVCEAEGGDAEMTDAYTMNGKKTYFLFTCSWLVQHSGIGLQGIQSETFVYAGKGLVSLVKKEKLSQELSGYEGSLEGGGISFAWYVRREIAKNKILELEAGTLTDSINLARKIVLTRLKSDDYDAIKHYLSYKRIRQLFLEFLISKSTVVAYNDFGYALGLSGKTSMHTKF